MTKNSVLFLSVAIALEVPANATGAAASDNVFEAVAGLPVPGAAVTASVVARAEPSATGWLNAETLADLRAMEVKPERIAMAIDGYNQLRAIPGVSLPETPQSGFSAVSRILASLACIDNRDALIATLSRIGAVVPVTEAFVAELALAAENPIFFEEIARKVEEFKDRFLESGIERYFLAWVYPLIKIVNPFRLTHVANGTRDFAVECARRGIELDAPFRVFFSLAEADILDLDKFVGECKRSSDILNIPFSDSVIVLSNSPMAFWADFPDAFDAIRKAFERSRGDARHDDSGIRQLLPGVPGKLWGAFGYLRECPDFAAEGRTLGDFIHHLNSRRVYAFIEVAELIRVFDEFRAENFASPARF